MAVFAVVYAAADVEPPYFLIAFFVVLQYQLVVVGVLLGIHQQQTCGLLIVSHAEGAVLHGDGQVGSLTLHVLRCGHTVHQRVYMLTAVAAVHLYWQFEGHSYRLQATVHQILQRSDVQLQRNVGDRFRLMVSSCVRVTHLAESEMRREAHAHVNYLLHIDIVFRVSTSDECDPKKGATW